MAAQHVRIGLLVLGLAAACPAVGQPPPAVEPAVAQPAAKPRGKNHLAGETSPYLLQHADNPVAWFPWGPAALAKARAEGKLIFVSIGYASCHWCHIMERESFRDEEIARLLNEHFVCIKIDREERPDVDHVFMTALQTYNQLAGGNPGGGWPLSMFLTPEGDPFFGGTYFPARDGDREGLTGFLTVLRKVHGVWGQSPERIRQDARTLVEFTRTELQKRQPLLTVPLDESAAAAVQKALADDFDPTYGGFGWSFDGRSPKFPQASKLQFLLAQLERGSNPEAARLLTTTLDEMARGGIRDHLGGGFHRYSVDRYWRIPHFEKMLYDNAQLAGVYAQAFARTGRAEYRRVAEATCDFLLRELADPAGGFYAAIDADSEGGEGTFYRWEKTQLEATLAPDELRLVAAAYGFDGPPNFEGRYYVPLLRRPLADVAADLNLTEAVLESRLQPLRAKLALARAQRPRPRTDDKILTAENGLAIAGLAEAGRILERPDYVVAAARAAEFLWQRLRTPDGRLLRSYAAGQARFPAYLDDYAFFAQGLLRLHAATGEQRWLDRAAEVTARQLELFADRDQGGFYSTAPEHQTPIARTKPLVDGALPSGNAIAAANLIDLAVLRGDAAELPLAEKTLALSLATTQAAPDAAPLAAAAIFRLAKAKEQLQRR